EDKDIIVVHKPAGIAVQTARIGQVDVVSELKNYLHQPYLGIIHRLDQPVEGVLVFGKTKEAAAGLSRQLAGDDFCKEYLAVVCGQPDAGRHRLVDYLGKEDGRAVIMEEVSQDGKKAVLYYECQRTKVIQDGTLSLLQIRLETGRFHQIRAQLSHAGFPILGDSKYGNAESCDMAKRLGIRNTALCACRLRFVHPVSKKKMEVTDTPANRAFALLEE
ncbi:MAG: RluA family pseudouridine synthase, partial [Lachnospiraceae bacterium]